MLDITYEEIVKCLKMSIKTDDCDVLLWDDAAIKLMEESYNKTTREYKLKAKELISKRFRCDEGKINLEKSKTDYYSAKKILEGYETRYKEAIEDKIDKERDYEKAKAEAQEKYDTATASSLKYYDRHSKIWKEVNDYETLKQLNNTWTVGHMPGNLKDRRDAPDACCWDSSPEIKLECKNKLEDKLNKFQEHEKSIKRMSTTQTKVKEANTVESNTKDKYEEEARNLRILEKRKSDEEKMQAEREELIKQLEEEVKDTKKQANDDAWYLEEIYKFNQQQAPDIDSPPVLSGEDINIGSTSKLLAEQQQQEEL